MTFIAWNTKVSVGAMELDGQHAQLLQVFAELHAAMVGGKSHHTVMAIFSRLIANTGEHFRCEEQQMAAMGFAGLQAHRRDHQILLMQAAAAHAQFSSSNLLLSMTTFEFLKQWFVEHIEQRDSAYDAFVAARGTPVSETSVASSGIE